jgi:non-lysosomal glucosylceramidase
MPSTLFPLDLPDREPVQFSAEGFASRVSGMIHHGTNPPVCGLPLGGIDTGCLDIEARGLLGYTTQFNSLVPRRGPLNEPFLGISTNLQAYVLTTLDLAWREGNTWQDIYHGDTFNGIRTASEIHMFGHYPIADMEFVTECPVSVGLRAWSPFIPGDTAISNTPGAVFEVRLRNTSDDEQNGALAFSFPGPSEKEAGTTSFQRNDVDGGVSVSSNQASYCIRVIGEEVRTGGSLGVNGEAWATIERYLPYTKEGAGTSVAVDFTLAPNEERTIRYILAWHAPQWDGGGTMTAGGNRYHHMYAARYDNAEAVAELLVQDHESLLARILAWQSVVYDEDLPVWLRDSLVNVLHLIPETSIWAQAKSPVGDWCDPTDGLFGMNEAPRTCPQIECIPCSFYGNLPLVYFFPETALSTLRGYKAYQYPTGAAPWVFGGVTTQTKPYEMALPSPGYSHKPQTTLDGPCLVDMVDRMWMRTGDDAILREFYDMVKKNTEFTMNLRPGSGAAGIVSMPTDNAAQDWFESCDLFGIVPHIGGAHLAQLRMAHRMAEHMGDDEFATQCTTWIDEGSAVMEENTWNGSHYMLFHELETQKRSDIVMSYVFDGEWMALSHGLDGVFQRDRVETMLKKIEETAITAADFGASTFASPGGEFNTDEWDPGYWGTRGVHPPGTMMLAMVFLYLGQTDAGLELVRGTVAEIVKRGWYWDWPVCINGTWERLGMDYYQNLMLWALPAAIAGEDITTSCRDGGLVERMIEAAG